MESYRMTDCFGAEVASFEARHPGEAILRANEIDQLLNLTRTTLWIKQYDGGWLEV